MPHGLLVPGVVKSTDFGSHGRASQPTGQLLINRALALRRINVYIPCPLPVLDARWES
jgi:hypothetical protein